MKTWAIAISILISLNAAMYIYVKCARFELNNWAGYEGYYPYGMLTLKCPEGTHLWVKEYPFDKEGLIFTKLEAKCLKIVK